MMALNSAPSPSHKKVCLHHHHQKKGSFFHFLGVPLLNESGVSMRTTVCPYTKDHPKYDFFYRTHFIEKSPRKKNGHCCRNQIRSTIRKCDSLFFYWKRLFFWVMASKNQRCILFFFFLLWKMGPHFFVAHFKDGGHFELFSPLSNFSSVSTLLRGEKTPEAPQKICIQFENLL